MGYADPENGIGYGYVTNRMGIDLSGDPRDVALRAALAAAMDRSRRERTCDAASPGSGTTPPATPSPS
jgi:hypothetical protein